ncbi:MAG: filamentous hemagglutinin N-terminal domain-containing protein [Steroidobacteraceae bacterium]|nr:filamentous hemagglutinin N-terminal domain-containing protein [Steroidobacteraceae bacterium]
MNHTYRLVWSDAAQAFVAVSELARARGKRASSGIVSALIAAGLFAVPPAPSFAASLPEGGQIAAGAGAIAQSGNTMTITQTSDKLAVDWQSFSIGPGHAVRFLQPSSAAIALNRVLGADVSLIQGSLSANGQVFLINPNGVLFTPTARVDVGGLVASTRNLTNEDFLAGRYRFSGASEAAIGNEGEIKAGAGGTVALIAARIENTGTIAAPQGNVLMGAGNTVRLDLGGPVKIEVEEGALNALIEQGGAIRADGGLVYLTAQAAGDLGSAAINHRGITEARSIATGEDGQIYLMADMARGQVNVAGTLDAGGGFVETSAAKVKVADGTRVSAGHWLIDPTDYTIAATGGDISGATLSSNLASSNITIQTSATGSGNGDIFVRDNVTWNSGRTLTLSAHRNIEILATLDASGASGGKVALEYGQGALAAGNTASYSFGLTGAGFTGRINLQAGNNFTTKLGSDGTPINWTVITALGSAGDESNASATNSLQGLAHSSRLSGNYVLGADINASATSGWNVVSGFPQGFMPIGTNTTPFTGRFDGLGHTISNLFISRYLSEHYQGLFGRTASSAQISHVELLDPSISGTTNVGALVGRNDGAINQSFARKPSTTSAMVLGTNQVGGLVGANGGSIQQSYATGTVSGPFATASSIGGLVGESSGTIIQSYATGQVSSSNDEVGGLVGKQAGGSITQSYATGAVSGDVLVGGLVGNKTGGTITQSYATGAVSGSSDLGGLVGRNTSGAITASFYATTDASGNTINNGGASGSTWSGNGNGTAKTSAELKQLATFTGAGWDIDDAGGTGKVWRIYEGDTTPLLRSFLTPLTIDSASPGSKTYDGVAVTTVPAGLFTITASHDSSKVLFGGTLRGQKNASNYTAALYSTQDGYDLIGTRSVDYHITPKSLTASYAAANKVYDGTTAATVTGTSGDIIAGDSVTISATGSFADKNAGTGKTVSIAGGALSGADAGNYSLANATGSATANITPKSLTASYAAANKVYDGTTAATVTGTSGDIIAGDSVTISATGSFADKNAGTGKTVSIAGGALSGADAGNYSLANATGSATANITPRPITVTADAKSKTAGHADPPLTYTTGCGNASAPCGLVAGETLTGSLSRAAGEDVGIYAIQQGTVTGASNPNYAITYVGANLTIAAAPGPGESVPGDASAGKSALLAALAGFYRSTAQPTISTDRADVTTQVEGTGIRLPKDVLSDDEEQEASKGSL